MHEPPSCRLAAKQLRYAKRLGEGRAVFQTRVVALDRDGAGEVGADDHAQVFLFDTSAGEPRGRPIKARLDFSHPRSSPRAPVLMAKLAIGLRVAFLRGRYVYVASLYYVGKESNFVEDVESGLLHDLEEVQQKYLDPREDPWTPYVAPVLKLMRRKAGIAQSVGVSERYIQFLRNGGKRRPSPTVQAKLTGAAADYVREKLGANTPTDDIAACAVYLESETSRQPK